MAYATVACPMCGHVYRTDENGSCTSCPLGSGCAATCCPACGYSSVDPSRSSLVQWGGRLSRLVAGRRAPRHAAVEPTLAQALPGTRVQVAAVAELPVARREELASYGLAPGRWLDVVQQSPVTVVRVDHIDLAFEGDVAGAIRVVAGTDPGA